MWRVWGRREGCTGFWWGNLRERDHWGDPDADGRIILRWISWLHRASNNVETFLLPTDAHNVKKHRVIKTF